MTETADAPAFAAAEHRYEVRDLDSIRPYWRNPRTIPEQAVNAVMDSIKRYGYRNPIIVTNEGIILTGHTRYAALRKLGAARITVQVADDLTPEQAREFRVIDNKAAEFSGWDFDALVLELREFTDEALLDVYFPEVDLEIGTLDGIDAVTNEEVQKATEKITETGTAKVVEVVNVTCPSCFHSFDVKADTL